MMSKCKTCTIALFKKTKLENYRFFYLENHFPYTVNGKIKLVSKTKLHWQNMSYNKSVNE